MTFKDVDVTLGANFVLAVYKVQHPQNQNKMWTLWATVHVCLFVTVIKLLHHDSNHNREGKKQP